jgi:hypothetical protein
MLPSLAHRAAKSGSDACTFPSRRRACRIRKADKAAASSRKAVAVVGKAEAGDKAVARAAAASQVAVSRAEAAGGRAVVVVAAADVPARVAAVGVEVLAVAASLAVESRAAAAVSREAAGSPAVEVVAGVAAGRKLALGNR